MNSQKCLICMKSTCSQAAESVMKNRTSYDTLIELVRVLQVSPSIYLSFQESVTQPVFCLPCHRVVSDAFKLKEDVQLLEMELKRLTETIKTDMVKSFLADSDDSGSDLQRLRKTLVQCCGSDCKVTVTHQSAQRKSLYTKNYQPKIRMRKLNITPVVSGTNPRSISRNDNEQNLCSRPSTSTTAVTQPEAMEEENEEKNVYESALPVSVTLQEFSSHEPIRARNSSHSPVNENRPINGSEVYYDNLLEGEGPDDNNDESTRDIKFALENQAHNHDSGIIIVQDSVMSSSQIMEDWRVSMTSGPETLDTTNIPGRASYSISTPHGVDTSSGNTSISIQPNTIIPAIQFSTSTIRLLEEATKLGDAGKDPDALYFKNAVMEAAIFYIDILSDVKDYAAAGKYIVGTWPVLAMDGLGKNPWSHFNKRMSDNIRARRIRVRRKQERFGEDPLGHM